MTLEELEKSYQKLFTGLSVQEMEDMFIEAGRLLNATKMTMQANQAIKDCGIDFANNRDMDVYTLMSGLQMYDVSPDPMSLAIKATEDFGDAVRDLKLDMNDKKGFKGANQSHQNILNKQRRKKR